MVMCFVLEKESLLDVNWRECTKSRSHGDEKGHLRGVGGHCPTRWRQGGTRRGWTQSRIQLPAQRPVAPGLATETLMHTSHNKAHAMESGQGVKKPDNYDCCALCLDRDASRQTLQGKKKRHKTTGLGRTAHTGTSHHSLSKRHQCERRSTGQQFREKGPAAWAHWASPSQCAVHKSFTEGQRCRAKPQASDRSMCVSRSIFRKKTKNKQTKKKLHNKGKAYHLAFKRRALGSPIG